MEELPSPKQNLLICNTFEHIEPSIKGKKNFLKIQKTYNENHYNTVKHA